MGIEPTHGGFADRSVTASPRRLDVKHYSRKSYFQKEKDLCGPHSGGEEVTKTYNPPPIICTAHQQSARPIDVVVLYHKLSLFKQWLLD